MIRNTKYNSFFGKAMYDHLVGKNHFLRRLNELVDRVDLSQGSFRLGAAVISPVTMLKMLLLSYLYNLSDRETERQKHPFSQENGVQRLRVCDVWRW